MEVSDRLETRAGAVSGLAAGILIIALTAMALIAFQPSPAAPTQAGPLDATTTGADSAATVATP
mgnify:CR=1 FL=1